MTSERRERVQELLQPALGRGPDERAAFLEQVDALMTNEDALTIIGTTTTDSSATTALKQANLVGQTLGPYDILSKLGAGAMGDVYHAWDPKLDRPVAIKVLSSAIGTDTDAPYPFSRRGAGDLLSKSSTRAGDLRHWRVDGRPFIVTELVEGQTLASRLTARPLPIKEAARGRHTNRQRARCRACARHNSSRYQTAEHLH